MGHIPQISIFATSNTTQSSSGLRDIRALTFAGAGGVSVGVTNGSVVISGGAGGGGGIAAQAGTQTATSGTVVFSNSNNVTFGMSNSSVVTASVGYAKVDVFVPFQGSHDHGNLANSRRLIMMPVAFGAGMDANALLIYPHWSNSSNSTGTATFTFFYGLYTRSSNTLSRATSSSYTYTLSFNGTDNNSLFFGQRVMSLPFAATISPGQYWLGLGSESASGGNNGSVSLLIVSQMNSIFRGSIGVDSGAASVQPYMGFGSYSTTATAAVASMQISQINHAGSVMSRSVPFIAFHATSF